jgi:signal peptidase II
MTRAPARRVAGSNLEGKREMPKRSWWWGPLSPFGVGVALITFGIDQSHKWWMLKIFRIEQVIETYRARQLPGVRVAPFLDLTYVLNKGVSYGLFAMDTTKGQWLWAGFAGIASVAMAVWLARGVADKLVAGSIGLIMGGALSNAVDRLVLGGVADFFSLHAFGFYWPYVFNIADLAIIAGVIGLLYDSFGPSRNRAAKST